jgi:hypothetical protein
MLVLTNSRPQNVGVNIILALTKCWHRQNSLVDKILALTKNPCLDKMLASTKSSGRQNVGIDKILASTKYWRIWKIFGWQNVGVEVSLLFWIVGVYRSWLYPDLADVLLSLPEGVDLSTCSRQVCVAAVRPAFMGRLSPALCRLIVPASHAK